MPSNGMVVMVWAICFLLIMIQLICMLFLIILTIMIYGVLQVVRHKFLCFERRYSFIKLEFTVGVYDGDHLVDIFSHVTSDDFLLRFLSSLLDDSVDVSVNIKTLKELHE